MSILSVSKKQMYLGGPDLFLSPSTLSIIGWIVVFFYLNIIHPDRLYILQGWKSTVIDDLWQLPTLLYNEKYIDQPDQYDPVSYHAEILLNYLSWTCSSGRVDLVEEKVKHSFYWLFFIIWLCYAWWFNFCLYVFYNSTLTWEISSIIDSTFSAGVLWYFVELRGGRGPGGDLLVVKLRSSQVNLPGLPTSFSDVLRVERRLSSGRVLSQESSVTMVKCGDWWECKENIGRPGSDVVSHQMRRSSTSAGAKEWCRDHHDIARCQSSVISELTRSHRSHNIVTT